MFNEIGELWGTNTLFCFIHFKIWTLLFIQNILAHNQLGSPMFDT